MPALTMFNLGKQPAVCHAAASQLIGHDHARHVIKALQQPPEKAFGCFGIPPWLNEYVERYAVLRHCHVNFSQTVRSHERGDVVSITQHAERMSPAARC
jgi:hypothetical protein